MLAALFLIPSTASAAMDRPVWTRGDFWEYEFTSPDPSLQANGTLLMEVTGTEAVVVNGTSYSTYHLDATLTIPFDSLVFTIPADLWFSTETFAIVQLEGVVNLTFGTISLDATVTVSGNPPQTIRWPLTPGDSWTSTTNVWTVTRNATGTTSYVNQTVTSNFAVESEGVVSVPAGNFTATPVRQTDPASGSVTRNYWSAAVGHWVRLTTYNSTGAEQGGMELSSWQYQGPGSGLFGQIILGLPLFAWILLALVVIVLAVVAIAAARRGRRPPARMSPSEPEMPPTEWEAPEEPPGRMP